jgi:hypothetical protein
MRDADTELCSNRHQTDTPAEERSRHPAFPGRNLNTAESIGSLRPFLG